MDQKPKDSQKNKLRLAFSNWGFTWKGFIDNYQGEWWLIAQLTVISAHLMPPPAMIKGETIFLGLTQLLIGIIIFSIGIILAIKAFVDLGSNLSPLPEPKEGAFLVIDGAYKSCRHPLYQALIISSCGVFIGLGSLLHFILSINLCLVLIGKARFEERRLKHKYPGYNNYLAKTPAIIPNMIFLDWRD